MKLSDRIRKVWADKDGGSDLSQIAPLVGYAEELEAQLADAETRRIALDDGVDQKIAPLTKDNHPEQETSRVSDLPDFGEHFVDFTSGGHTTQLSCRYIAPGLTFQDITEIFYEAEKSLGATDRLSASPSKWPNMRGLLAVTVAIVRTMANAAPLSDPSPAVLNEELVRALEDFGEQVGELANCTCDLSPDQMTVQLAKLAHAMISRSKPSP